MGKIYLLLEEIGCGLMKCENCGKPVIPYLSQQRFCRRSCSDEFYQAERRQAVEWFRACGMRPQTKYRDEEAEEQCA
jgi:hypothetical protein